MTKLTEEMVAARTRISDLTQVKKLNFWGGDLSDVGLLKYMPNVEILALSVNNISTLADIQYCKRLQELYIRKNNIVDLKEICYLKDLPQLKNLWIADNPCAETEGYRLSVLRTIPQLQKLDDVVVQSEELKEAMKKGKELNLPSQEDVIEPVAPVKRKESIKETNNNQPVEREVSRNTKERSASPMRPQASKVAEVLRDSLDDDGLTPVQETKRQSKSQQSLPAPTPQQQQQTKTPPSRRTSAVEESPSRRISGTEDAGPPLRRPNQNQAAGIPTQSTTRKHSSQVSEEISSWRRSVAELHPEIREDEVVVTRPTPHAPQHQEVHQDRVTDPYAYDRYQHVDQRGCPVHASASSRPQSRQLPGAELYHQEQYHQPTHLPPVQPAAHLPPVQPTQMHRPASMDSGYQRSPAYGHHGMDQDSLNGRFNEQIAELNQQFSSFGSRNSRSAANRASWTEGAPFPQHPLPVENGHLQYDRAFRSPFPPGLGAIPPAMSTDSSPHAPRISPSRHYAQRARSRTSNLLTAALCIVKELDIGSLEVLEMAVRSRIEELED